MIDIAIKIAWKLYGQPYRWGGDDPLAGFDCSGFVIEILKSVGILPRRGDWTADQLYQIFLANPCDPKRGALVFWPKASGKMRHVEFCLNSELTIGASGGGRAVEGIGVAVAQNAYVKVRPFHKQIRGRSEVVPVFVDPFKNERGEA